MDRLQQRFRNDTLVKLFTTGFFLAGFVEIIAEYYNDITLVYFVKPLIVPMLMLLYWYTSRRRDPYYLIALVCSFIANIFFISSVFQSILIGAVFFFFFRIIIIKIVLKYCKLPGILPLVIGGMPFFFAYLYLITITYKQMGDGLIIFIVQCVVISFLGGIAVGNYILQSSKANTLLLLSTLLFAMTQFIFAWRLFVESNIFQPAAMALFVLAQYLFYKFLLLAEIKKAGNQFAQT